MVEIRTRATMAMVVTRTRYNKCCYFSRSCRRHAIMVSGNAGNVVITDNSKEINIFGIID